MLERVLVTPKKYMGKFILGDMQCLVSFTSQTIFNPEMRLVPALKNLTSRCHFSGSSNPQRIVAKSVYFSKCTDIFTNLALEDWLYKNSDFSNHHLLMLWQNEPCVVIGRHQNPWLECNFATLPFIENGVKLARRNSGGGTVYHDMRNLNLTFFTSKQEYSRKRNLELISRALRRSFNIHSEISPREDLCIRDRKISGTASKLGRTTAYHHCTILVDANKENLSLALKNPLGEQVKTTATRSVKSKIMNLSEEEPNITVEQVLEAIVIEFTDRSVEFGDFADSGHLPGVKIIDSIDEDNFPGISEIKDTFRSDQWLFEKTPKFQITRNICDKNSLNVGEDSDKLLVFLTVEQGKVCDCGIKNGKQNCWSVNCNDLGELGEVFNGLIGRNFSEDVLNEFEVIVSQSVNREKCRHMVFDIK